ncbi:MAG: hypothetical protein HYT08_00055 [Candidatus Levybacteria bacterium]|nr:hypothetical protein [Candidatus Levybacteria bacterium]
MKKEEGQSLVEAVIAMTAAIIVVSSIVAAIVLSLNNAQYSKYQNLATQYAQEGIEIVKKISVADWNSFSSGVDVNYCLPEGSLAPTPGITCSANVYQVGNPPTPIFRRSVKIEHNFGTCNPGSRITSKVSWSDSKCTSGDIYCHSVELNTCVTRSQNISTP